MEYLLGRIKRAQATGSHFVVLSDSNDFFVGVALRNLRESMEPDRIISNRTVFPINDLDPEANFVEIEPYENQTECTRCPVNLCKGSALMKYIAEEGPFENVYYAGDGKV